MWSFENIRIHSILKPSLRFFSPFGAHLLLAALFTRKSTICSVVPKKIESEKPSASTGMRKGSRLLGFATFQAMVEVKFCMLYLLLFYPLPSSSFLFDRLNVKVISHFAKKNAECMNKTRTRLG